MGRTTLQTLGTTSACAENTHPVHPCEACCWNYLRVRGEYAVQLREAREIMELPPRARRIPITYKHGDHVRGTTSACAENTVYDEAYNLTDGNYLRVRGEYPK